MNVRDEKGRLVQAPIHGWFGLTYSNYLVLPRSILQNMPHEWQTLLIRLLEEADDLGVTSPEYEVKRRGDDGKYMDDPYANYRHFDKCLLPPALQPENTEAK